MHSTQSRRPSPGTVLGTLALVVALGGTAIAADGGATKSAKKVTVPTVKKIAQAQAKKLINKQAKKLSVKHARTAGEATTGAAAAYAAVNANGSLTSGYAVKGLSQADISRPDTGVYCFNLPFTPRTAAANAQSEGEEDGILSIDLVSPYADCPDGADAEVRNVDGGDSADQDDDFIVQFDK